VCVRTTHEGRLVVIIAVQNLVGIGEIVLIICMFFDFAPQKSHSANANRGRGFQICISQDTARNALHAQSEFECVRRGCETATLAVDRQLGHSFATPKVPESLSRLRLDRLSDSRTALRAS